MAKACYAEAEWRRRSYRLTEWRGGDNVRRHVSAALLKLLSYAGKADRCRQANLKGEVRVSRSLRAS